MQYQSDMTSSSIGSYYTEYMQRARFCIIVFLYVVWENSSHRLPFSIALKLQYFTDDKSSYLRSEPRTNTIEYCLLEINVSK